MSNLRDDDQLLPSRHDVGVTKFTISTPFPPTTLGNKPIQDTNAPSSLLSSPRSDVLV